MYYEKETFIEEDTRNIAHRTMMLQSPSTEAPWDLTQFSQSPSAALLYFPESHRWSETSSLSRRFRFWEKPEVTGHQVRAVRRAESPG